MGPQAWRGTHRGPSRRTAAGINSEKKQFKEQKEEAEKFDALNTQKVWWVCLGKWQWHVCCRTHLLPPAAPLIAEQADARLGAVPAAQDQHETRGDEGTVVQ